MADFPSQARVVIIGGGAVGVSTLYHLAKAGWTDCVLLEKNELTAGSTWHAAGNCPNFSTSWAVMNMQRYSLEQYRSLADEVDYPMNYNVTGAIRLAHTKDRMREFEHVASQARAQGLEMEMCTPEELQKFNPFMETHELAGGLWDPLDGDIDPAQLTQAFAKGARDMGQQIIRFCPVTGVDRQNDEWIIKTEKGDIHAEYVVNAAGYYAQRVGEWFKPFGGRTVPMVVMSHQYFLTGEIPELEAWTKEQGRKMPMTRDVDTSYYLRQDKHGLNLGPYEMNCKAHWVTPQDPMPEDFSFQLYPDDLDRLEYYIEDAMARVPILGTQGVERVINGPIPYAPDGLPLIGPMPGVKNAFEAHTFTFGIVQSGGAGKTLSEWIMHGETEWDMWAVDPRRFTDYTDFDYCLKKGLEVYGNEYVMHFPHHEWPAARDKKLSPNHDKLKEMGAQFGVYNGWERANWFAKDGDDTSEEATLTWNREGPWEQRVKEECETVRDACGMIDMVGFSRYQLSGEGAADWLRSQITGGLPKVGRMNLGYMSDSRGRVVTEISITRHDTDEFTLMTAAVAQWHDFEFLKKSLPDTLTLKDLTNDVTIFLVTGPTSRDVLSKVTDADLSSGWLTHQAAKVAGKKAHLARVSFAGELGWEVHIPMADAKVAYEAILEAGAKPFGMFALNSLRIEKAYRSWKGDMSTDYTLFESDLGRFVKMDKPDFPGKAALEAEKAAGAKKAFAVLFVEGSDFDAPAMSPLFKGDKAVGEVTSGGFGYRLNKSIALAIVSPDVAKPGEELEVELYGERYKAVVQENASLWDADNERLRA